jgi:tRNA(Ile)-lysidine synthase
LQPRHDASNDSLDHTRNRVRHELLPVLQQFNPGVKTVLARLADSAGAELDVIAYATNAAFAAHARQQSSGVTVDRSAWRALPPGLQRALLRECVRRVKGELTNLNYAAVEEARNVLNSAAPTADIALMADVRIVVRAPDFFVTGER